MTEIISLSSIEERIITLRGKKVIHYSEKWNEMKSKFSTSFLTFIHSSHSVLFLPIPFSIFQFKSDHEEQPSSKSDKCNAHTSVNNGIHWTNIKVLQQHAKLVIK